VFKLEFIYHKALFSVLYFFGLSDFPLVSERDFPLLLARLPVCLSDLGGSNMFAGELGRGLPAPLFSAPFSLWLTLFFSSLRFSVSRLPLSTFFYKTTQMTPLRRPEHHRIRPFDRSLCLTFCK